jgi:hypothetical protein
MSLETVETVLKNLEDFAKTVYFQVNHSSLPPTWYLVKPEPPFGNLEKKDMLVSTPWETPRDKETAINHIWAFMLLSKVKAYGFITEAWLARVTDQELESENFVRPTDRPDRQECLLAFATDNEITRWKKWSIVRNWEERITAIREQALETSQGDEPIFESYLTELLRRER